MTSYNTIETPQDYVNYTFNISSRGVTEVMGEMAGLSNTVTTILGQLAFKTSEYLTHTESMVIGMSTAAIAAYASATQEAMKFEQQVANVQAIGGESINAMEIGQAAMQYSNQFAMDVNSMTEGLEALARAGLTATDVMSGVLAEGVKLSKLEGIDLEDSINHLISTTNLLAEGDLNINSREYAEAVKAMNQHIVSTSESAPINAENIIQSLQHVGGYASANKIDQDDLFAVIAQLGAKGTKGEMAGTALRAFVAAGQKDQAQRALGRIGLNVSDLWDETGEAMLPISEMKDVIDNALEARGYSKQEKLEFYSDFAGYKQANQIMKIDTAEVQEYKKTIANAWDLGTKLDTILGTTQANLQTLFQTVKNFMTRVGSTMLPILNAIVIPIKWGVQLLDAIPFSENITGILLAVTALKGILLFINRVVPTLATMYTSFSDTTSDAEKNTGKIRRHISGIVGDLQQAKHILTNIGNKRVLSDIRLKQGLMGEQSYQVHKEVTKKVYEKLVKDDPNQKGFDDLSYTEKEVLYNIMEAYKDAQMYQDELKIITNQFSDMGEMVGKKIFSEASQQKTSKSVPFNESNREKNDNISQQEKAFRSATDKIYNLEKVITNDDIKISLKNDRQNDIGNAIIGVKDALADAIGRAVAQSLRTKDVVISEGLGSFKIDGIKASNIKDQLRKIEDNVSDNLGDIGYFLDYDLDKINNLLSNVGYDLQKKITAYSNNDVEYANSMQKTRMEKIISGAAKTNLGRLYSEEQNSIDILNVLRNKQWNNPGDNSDLGIHDRQMSAMESALGMEEQKGLGRTERLNNIHDWLQSHYSGEDKEARIQEILQETGRIWSEDISGAAPSREASKYLTDTRAAFIGNALDLGGISWNEIENPAQALIDYFADAQENTQKMTQLKQADSLMFKLMEQAKGDNDVFNQSEADELGYLIRRYKQLLLARNKKIEEELGVNAIINPKHTTSNPSVKKALEDSASTYAWNKIPKINNADERVLDFLTNSDIRLDKNIPLSGFNRKGIVRINDNRTSSPQSFVNVLMHEMGHGLLQHTLRGDIAGKDLSLQKELQQQGLYIPEALSVEGSKFGKPIAEYETDLLSKIVLSNMGLDTSFHDKRLEKLESIIEKDYGSLDAVNIELVEATAKSVINNQTMLSEIISDLLKQSEHRKNFQIRDVLNTINPAYEQYDYSLDYNEDDDEYSRRIQFLEEQYDKPTGFNQVDNQYNNIYYEEITSTLDIISQDVKKIIEQLTPKELDIVKGNNGDISSNGIKDLTDAINDGKKMFIEFFTMFRDKNATPPLLEDDDFIETQAIIQDANSFDFTTPFSNYDDLQTAIEEEVNFFSQFASTFLAYQAGMKILSEENFSNMKDDFNQIAININKRILQQQEFANTLIVPLFETLIEQQEEEMQKIVNEALNYFFKLRPLKEEFITNTRNFGEYLLGHSFIVEEDVSSELSNYITDKLRNIIDEVLNPSDILVQIPESNGAFDKLKEKNKELEIKNKEPEIIIGSYRVPGEPQEFESPININPYNPLAEKRFIVGKVGKEVSDTIALQNLKHAKQEGENIKKRAENYMETLDYVIQAEESMNDFLNMAHNIHNELAIKHSMNPNSLTENELDFINLNKERNNKRRIDYGMLLHANEIINAQEKANAKREERENAKRERKKYKQNLRGPTDDLIEIRDYPIPIGPKPAPKISGKEMAAKILGVSVDDLKGGFELQKEINKNQKYIDFVDKNFVTEGPAYLPTAMKPTTGEGIAAVLRANKYFEEENKRVIDLVNETFIDTDKPLDFSGMYKQGTTIIDNGDLDLNNLQNATNMLNMFNAKIAHQQALKEAQARYRKNTASNSDLILLGITTPSKIEEERGRQKADALERESEGVKRTYARIREQQEYNHAARSLSVLFNDTPEVKAMRESQAMQATALMFDNFEKERDRQKAAQDTARMFNDFDKEYEHAYKAQKFGYRIGNYMEKISNTIKDKAKNVDNWLNENFLPQYDSDTIWSETATQIENAIEPLKIFNSSLNNLANIFPILTPLVYGLDKILGTAEFTISALRQAELLLMAVRIASGAATDDLAQKEGYKTAKKWADKLTQYIPEGSDLYKIGTRLGEYGGRALGWVKNFAKTAIGFIAENIMVLGPIALGIAAAVGALWLSEQNHAKALKEATEEQEKAQKEASASYLKYKNLRDARRAETDEMKRQQLARKESVALYQLEADRIKQLNAINKETELRNDPLWGEYGERARLQKMGWLESIMADGIPFVGTIGKLLAGDFQSQAENYDGTTKQIRLLKESSLTKDHGLSGNLATSYVGRWYDANKMQLGQIEAFGPELQELYDTESRLIEQYGSIESARDSEEFKKAVQEFADATGLNRETAEKYLDFLQTEHNVELATDVMQAQISQITAKAYAKVAENEYGPMANMGDMDNLQNAMIFANFNEMWKDAYNEMYWNMLMEYLQAIISMLSGPIGWGDALKHMKNASAYGEAQNELLMRGNEIYQSGVDIAEQNQRRDYGNQSYSYYNDTPFGGALESLAAQEQDWMIENAYSNQSKTYDASEANGKAAVKGFKDGLNQHSPGDIAMAMADELGFMQHFITVFPSKIFSKLAQKQTDEYQNNLNIGESFDFISNPQFSKKTFRRQNNIETIQKDVLYQQRKLNETVENIDNNVDSNINQWYASGHNNGDNSLSTRTKNAFWYDKGFGLPEGVDPNDPAVQEELNRRRKETATRAGGHAISGGISQYLFNRNGAPIGAKGTAKEGVKLLAHLLNPEDVPAPGWTKIFGKNINDVVDGIWAKIFGRNSDDFIDVSGKVVDDAVEIGAKNTDDILKLGANGLDTASKTGGELVVKEAGGELIETSGKVVSKNGGKASVDVIEQGVKNAGKGATKSGSKGAAKAAGKALFKAAPYIGPAVTAAFSIAEHNPFEKHYNEDGSEKRAFQSSGEVVGEVGGALAAAGLGAVAGLAAESLNLVVPGLGIAAAPFIAGAVEMGTSLILEPVGKAVGGLIGWAGDEVFNNSISLLSDAGSAIMNTLSPEDNNQINPSDISSQVDSSSFDRFKQSLGDSSITFNGTNSSFNKTDNISADNSKTEIHIHNLNINVEDDPDKIKTVFMDLMVELGDQVTPRQVSRTIGGESIQTTEAPQTNTETDTDSTIQNNQNNNTSTN